MSLNKKVKKDKKDFDKEKMYSKIMPSVVTPPPRPERAEKQPPDEEDVSFAEPQYVLRNFVEDIVLDKLDHTITILRCCDCELCKKEVMALALNEIPSVYTVIEAGQVEETLKTMRVQYEVKVASALIKAVQTVKTNPKH